MPQFIGYHIDNSFESVPVATGATHDDAMALTVRRVLSIPITDGEMSVQQRDDVSAEDFAKLTETLDAYFAGRGIQ